MSKQQIDYYEYMKQQMKRQLQEVKYCAFCGKPVLPFSSNEDGYANRNVDWEMQNSAHWDCYMKAMNKRG